jgi:hypothetical protein
MNVRLLFAVFMLLAAFAFAGAQEPTAQQKASDATLAKVRKLEVYNQLLPVLLTQDQVKALLKVVEKHRAEAAKMEAEEFKWLQSVDKEISDELKASEERGVVPDPKVLDTVILYFTAFSLKRKALIDETVIELAKAMKANLNEGQIRAAANALDSRFYTLTKPKEELTENERLDVWIRVVLLENHAYHILVEMAKKK